MPKCSVKRCRNRSERNKKLDGISYHRVPTDPVKKMRWTGALIALGKDKDWCPSRISVVCSDHFHENDFVLSDNGKRVHLKRNATPLFKNREEKDSSDTFPDIVAEATSQNEQMSPGSLEYTIKYSIQNDPDDDLGDLDDDIEVLNAVMTPREYSLQKTLEHKTKLLVKKTRDFKCLHTKYTRLQTKVTALIDIIKNMEQERGLTDEQGCALPRNPEMKRMIGKLIRTGTLPTNVQMAATSVYPVSVVEICEASEENIDH